MAEGGCFCGAVRYSVSSAPSNSMLCHCRTCRRVAAAPVVAWLTFDRPVFRFSKGHPAEFRSTPPVRRMFCTACGTPLTYEHEGQPGTIDVTTCSLDDPGLFPPTHHSWLAHDLEWVRFGDALPTYPLSRPEEKAP